MVGTILSYLKEYGDRELGQMPFNDVDSLILCQLSYLKFDGLVPDVNLNVSPVSLQELARHEAKEKLFADERYEKVNRELFEAMAAGKRFGNLKLNAYVNLIEKKWETQFSAVTIGLDNGRHYLAYRGTDESIVGWKEDCNMAFLSPIPAQHCAVKYCNLVTGRWSGDFYLGGHSKGGNLAVYAGMNCHESLRGRLLKIYNMDGPGFRPEIREKCAYDKISDKIVKILPHSSFIGMLFERDRDYHVVESKSFGLFQHDPYSWIVEGDHFAGADDVYEGRKLLDQTFNDWMDSLSEEESKAFIDAFFRILEASTAEDLIELGNDKKKSFLGMMEAIKNMDPQTAQMMKKVCRRLLEIAGGKALKELEAWLSGEEK